MTPIIALDFKDQATTLDFLKAFPQTERLFVKIGMELFYAEGPAVIKAIQAAHPVDIFLDLKLHDIPNTVEKAAWQLGRLGVALTTVHAAGGKDMMLAAKRGLLAGAKAAHQPAPKLLAITHLTSTDQAMLENQLSIDMPISQAVQRLAAIAQASDADGVVASALETPLIRSVTKPDFLVVTPGIRPRGTAVGDQKRVVTPGRAKRLGSSAIVIGRPITQADDPVAAYQSIKKAWETAHD